MRVPKRPSRICWFIGAVAALWLCGAGAARAGDGSDLAGLQTYIDDVCSTFGMTSCPQIPTITQAVLQVAAFVDIAPEAVRSSPSFAIPVGPYVDAGNPSHPPGLECLGKGCVDPLNPIAFPIDTGVLSSLRPLAFAGATSSTGSAAPKQLYDPSANVFVYAVGGLSSANTNNSEPDTLVLFYDDPTRTTAFPQGQVAGKFLLPLTVLNKDGTERQVPATLQYVVAPAHAAPCSASTITGNFAGNGTQTRTPAQIGINCALVFAKSAISPSSPAHAIFEISIPMLITTTNDPVITNGSPLGFGAPFHAGDPGFASGVIGSGQSIGVGPNAGPLCTTTTCPQHDSVPAGSSPPPTTTTQYYGLCANLPTNAGGPALLPSVSGFLAIAGDGEVFLSAPLSPSITIVCPAM